MNLRKYIPCMLIFIPLGFFAILLVDLKTLFFSNMGFPSLNSWLFIGAVAGEIIGLCVYLFLTREKQAAPFVLSKNYTDLMDAKVTLLRSNRDELLQAAEAAYQVLTQERDNVPMTFRCHSPGITIKQLEQAITKAKRLKESL